MLDHSFAVSADGSTRLSVDMAYDEIGVLMRHKTDPSGTEYFNGHVREWSSKDPNNQPLDNKQKAALLNRKWVNKKGYINIDFLN